MSIVCEECHKHCETILKLRMGSCDLGRTVARKQGRNPNYYDGFMDGLKEAIGALQNETGLYWGELHRLIEESDKHDQNGVI